MKHLYLIIIYQTFHIDVRYQKDKQYKLYYKNQIVLYHYCHDDNSIVDKCSRDPKENIGATSVEIALLV